MRSDLPSGTVTFLFTDVEGSTRLLHELGAEAYAEALAEHRRVIREACTAHDGVEVDTQGDAFFFAFPTAPGALFAAQEMTEALAPGPVQVRIGLHTGTPLLADEGYVGSDVHRAARIAAAGHGGQVVVSASTTPLVEIELRDLGEHRFKDLSAPERVYQLGDGEFPPLKSLYRTNLPVPATAFLGRERELAEIVDLLESTRLLTLTGPGGTGKTRLALQAAAMASDSYLDGVWWIPLAPLRDPALVLATAAQTLGSKNGLAEHIADKSMLCLFDNFEQVVDAAPEVAALLVACPNLDVLVTSREPLHLTAEQEYAVPPLVHDEGVGLFLARARAIKPEFRADDAISEICAHLDDLPLALELAAARVKALSSAQILERLDERLPLLTGGARDAPERQRTLRATIEWSHELLSEEEQRLFARLAVFRGGCTLAAAVDVCEADLDTLQSLVDKSLLRFSNERYWMLETIREFAVERLDALGKADRLRRRHAKYLVELVLTLGFTIESIEAGATPRHDVAIAEHNNVRAAIDWALDADPVLGLRLATSFETFWISYSPFEASRMFEELVGRIDDLPLDLEALATRCRGNFAIFTGDREHGHELYEESLSQYQRLGDEHGQAIMEHRLGLNLIRDGDAERGRALVSSSLARSQKHGFRINEAMIRGSTGEMEYGAGNVERGLELMAEALDLAREVGYKWMQANLLNALANFEHQLGRSDKTETHARSALVVARDMGDRRHVVQALGLLAAVAAGRGERMRAGRLWGAVETMEQGGPFGQRPRLAPWELDRERFAALVFAEPGPDLERGLKVGRTFTLDQAVAQALADG